jgi:predicted transcriptional regulator
MGLNNSQKDAILARREQVAALRLRGRTQREIATMLGVSLGTVNGDLDALQTEWKANAAQDIEIHRAKMLAELEAVKAAGWGEKSPETVIKAIALESKLRGTDAPQKVEQTNRVEIIEVVESDGS